MNDFVVQKNSALILSQIYDKKDLTKAYEFLKISVAAKDTLTNLEKTKQIGLLEMKEKQRIDDLNLTNQENKSKLRFNTVLGILGTTLLLSLLLYRNNSQKQKANTKLQTTLSQLKATQNQLIQSEKLASLGELTAGIAHEIQNPLNFVNNFAELSLGLGKELKEEIEKLEIPANDKDYVGEIIHDLNSNQEKINHHGKRAASIVSGMIEHSKPNTGVRELTDINKLCDEYSRFSFNGLKAKNNESKVEMITHFDESLPKIEIVPQDIGRVIVNLINNAFYAVNERANKIRSGNFQSSPNLEQIGSYKPTVTI